MSFNGSGTFNLYAIGNPVVTGTTISASWANNTLSDIATGLSNCITRDGQSPATANIPMNSHKFTGLAAGTAAGDSARYEQVTSAVAITGGAIDGTAIGATTASTGAFSTLSASSTVSGAGFSTYLASPPAIGGTTPNTVSGTAVNASTQFNGAGTGLTGTASSLNIGGNAATVTNGIYTSGSYSNPSWLTGLAWSKISSTPTTVAGYGITDAITTGNIGSQSVSYATSAGSATTGTTQAQFDNTTNLATTAFVKQNGFSFSSSSQYNTTATLPASAMGQLIVCGGGGSYTITLPLSSGSRAGDTLTFWSQGANVTLQAQGSDTIFWNTSVTSILLPTGTCVTLFNNGSGTWLPASGISNLYGAIGDGQTWQDVTSSRALNTTYTNSTRKPIEIAYRGSGGSVNTDYTWYINGTAYGSATATSAAYEGASFSFIVPTGATYKIAVTLGSGGITQWSELR